MNSEVKKIVSLLNSLSSKDRRLLDKSMSQNRGKKLSNKFYSLLDTFNPDDNEIENRLLNELGYENDDGSTIRKFRTRLKQRLFKLLSSDECHRELKSGDPYTYNRCLVDKLVSAGRMANEKGNWDISGDLLKRALRISKSTENQEMHVETLRVLTRRSLINNSSAEYDSFKQQKDLEKAKLAILDQAIEAFNYFLLKIRHNSFEDVLPLLKKQIEVFEEMNLRLDFERIKFFILYSECSVLQIEHDLKKSLSKSFDLIRHVKQHSSIFNKYFYQLAYFKLAENLILTGRAPNLIKRVLNEKYLSKYQLYHTIDLRILMAWNQFHNEPNQENTDIESNAIFLQLDYVLNSINHTNDMISAHIAFTAGNFQQSKMLLNKIMLSGRKIDTPWVSIQIRILEMMILIEEDKFDLFNTKYENYLKCIERLESNSIRVVVDPINQILSELAASALNFKSIRIDKLTILKGEYTNTSSGIKGLYCAQPAFFINWVKSKFS